MRVAAGQSWWTMLTAEEMTGSGEIVPPSGGVGDIAPTEEMFGQAHMVGVRTVNGLGYFEPPPQPLPLKTQRLHPEKIEKLSSCSLKSPGLVRWQAAVPLFSGQ